LIATDFDPGIANPAGLRYFRNLQYVTGNLVSLAGKHCIARVKQRTLRA
jgi:hypothetical protein